MGEHCSDFIELIHHLAHDHGIYLKRNIDYCQSCSIIFEDHLEALNHYLAKAISLEEIDLACQNPRGGSDELRHWLAPVFEGMKKLRRTIIDRILYGEQIPTDVIANQFDFHLCGQ